jgi:hypothetical protein
MCPAIGLSVLHIGCVSKEFSFRVRNAISFKLTNAIGRYFSAIITRSYNSIEICIFVYFLVFVSVFLLSSRVCVSSVTAVLCSIRNAQSRYISYPPEIASWTKAPPFMCLLTWLFPFYKQRFSHWSLQSILYYWFWNFNFSFGLIWHSIADTDWPKWICFEVTAWNGCVLQQILLMW